MTLSIFNLFFGLALSLSLIPFFYILFLTLWIKLSNPRNPNETKVMILLGSGGHTGEMIRLLESVDMSKFFHRTWIATSGDSTSFSKAQLYEQSLKSLDESYTFNEIPRARKVGQSWLTTIFSSLLCLHSCFQIIINESPNLVF